MIDDPEWIVYGVPAPQGSKRHVGNGRMIESSKKVKPWREAVATATVPMVSLIPESEFYYVSLWFMMPRPKSHYRSGRYSHLLKPDVPRLPGRYPDIDKLCRSTLDALRMGGAYRDDAQVTTLHAFKRFAPYPQEPHARIRMGRSTGD